MSERTYYERPVEVRGHRYIKLKSGRLVSYWEMVDAAEAARTDLARAVSRAFKLAGDDYELERLGWLIDGLEEYAAALRAHHDERVGHLAKRERIALLRNVEGRTPEEAAAFNAKADQLERELDA